MAVDDVLATCENTIISGNVTYNDIYDENEPLRLTRFVRNGKNGNCEYICVTYCCLAPIKGWTYPQTTPFSSLSTILHLDNAGTWNGNEVTFSPNVNYKGRDTCQYEACVSNQETGEMDYQRCREATVRIKVRACSAQSPSVEPTDNLVRVYVQYLDVNALYMLIHVFFSLLKPFAISVVYVSTPSLDVSNINYDLY